MTGKGLDDNKDLVISKLLRQDIEKYKRLFAHVSADRIYLRCYVDGYDGLLLTFLAAISECL
jgi:hypothetical protein